MLSCWWPLGEPFGGTTVGVNGHVCLGVWARARRAGVLKRQTLGPHPSQVSAAGLHMSDKAVRGATCLGIKSGKPVFPLTCLSRVARGAVTSVGQTLGCFPPHGHSAYAGSPIHTSTDL